MTKAKIQASIVPLENHLGMLPMNVENLVFNPYSMMIYLQQTTFSNLKLPYEIKMQTMQCPQENVTPMLTPIQGTKIPLDRS